jgi:hypothetical protein
MSGVMLDQERVTVTVEPGVCRFVAKIVGWMEDGELKCEIQSGCKHVQDFAHALQPIGVMEVVTMPFSANPIYVVGGKTLKHSTCPLPMAVLKVFEAAGGLGLKRDVSVVFQK